MRRAAVIWALSVLMTALFLFPAGARSESRFLLEGIRQYKLENYEEALESLSKARKEDPKSTSAAFFLGLAYKQIMEFRPAAEHLRDAVTLAPRIKEALVELIEVLFRLGETGSLNEAKKWILVAKENKIFPAKVAFLEGLILKKEGRYPEAVAAFEASKSMDKSFSQTAEFQIGLSYVEARELKKAKSRFQAAILLDPQSDLALFARNYQDLVEKKMALEKPLHVTLGVFGQYNTNLLSKPRDPLFSSTGYEDEKSRSTATSLRLDFIPVFQGPWLFNGQYSLSGNFNDNHSTSNDFVANSFSVMPGYNFGRSALNLAVNYNHLMLKGPGLNKYSEELRAGPLYRVGLSQNNILEFFLGYRGREYSDPPRVPEEDRDSKGLSSYLSWIWLFRAGAFFNLRYEFADEDTDGDWWDNHGHNVSANVTIPLADTFRLQLSGQALIQDYKNFHTVFNTKREDRTYTGTLGFTWEFLKSTSLVAQYSRTRAESNIGFYDFERDLYAAGIEFRH
ncbi:MAG: tetratricopeptide repeat protein [Desulfobacterales bacterium]|nr:tetratricopeptide repeat protein [Desulfobacterales bacterium]